MDKLVNYTSSSDDDDKEEPLIKKQKLILPQPFKKEPTISKPNNRYNHQGRKRQIPHEEGNWSSHVFIDCSHLNGVLTEIIEKITSTYPNIEKIEEEHLSLSKNFILKYHWIDNFTSVLSRNLKFTSFSLKFDFSNIIFLSNEDHSRHFACIMIDESCDFHLKKLIDQTDKSLIEFELPKYYEKLILHVSIFWKLNEFTEDEKKLIREEFIKLDSTFYIHIDKICFKTGNKMKFFHSI
ncbi:hypothetical protein PVAND_009896 [Polypedilum vanderplanki]|uniref:U6 snRNA phosphodiesterase 1 n=1 Tax=Polypedilum vanderplanki TaxID=319348 RepID=A0A9J6CF37_POLVA|nr:hypothetical protein PVAND_009896 [Polypedilum vanderplanki]